MAPVLASSSASIWTVSYTHLEHSSDDVQTTVTLDEIPEYSGEPYIVLNDNKPEFSEDDLTEEAFETYSELDDLGRCGTAYANICMEIMPTEERGSIGQVRPTGWHTVKYDNVDGKYLYNRCHLIGYQLAGENANEKNLITGTRYMNCLLYTSTLLAKFPPFFKEDWYIALPIVELSEYPVAALTALRSVCRPTVPASPPDKKLPSTAEFPGEELLW